MDKRMCKLSMLKEAILTACLEMPETPATDLRLGPSGEEESESAAND